MRSGGCSGIGSVSCRIERLIMRSPQDAFASATPTTISDRPQRLDRRGEPAGDHARGVGLWGSTRVRLLMSVRSWLTCWPRCTAAQPPTSDRESAFWDVLAEQGSYDDALLWAPPEY